MIRTTGLIITLTGIAMLSSCMTVDEQVAKLKSENKALSRQLQERDRAVSAMKSERQQLQQDVAYYNQRALVLEKEKQARMKSTTEMRRGVREFTDGVMASLRSYYDKTELVDFVGAEVYARKNVGDEKNQLLIDMAHPMPSQGTLVGGTAYLTGPAGLVFCLVRPAEGKKKKGQYLVVRVSDAVRAEKRGFHSWNFTVPLVAKKGDFIGVYFPQKVAVPFDAVDTGNVVLVKGPVQPGDVIKPPPAVGRGKRAYSFGMVGFLNE